MAGSARRSHHFSIKLAAILLGMVTCASLARAQTVKTDYELNTPYVCPNGTSYTFTKRVGTGYLSECYYTVEHNGRLVTKAVTACRQMAGYLRGCKLQSTAPAPVAGPVEDWHSRPTSPAYLAAMPYVEQVKSTIKGSSPDDTLARQLTVFTYLPQMITHMREASRPYGSPWTPDETRITYAYNLAAKQITDDYAKSHTPQQTRQFSHLEGHYELAEDQFYKQWTQAVLPKDFLDAYNKAAWGMLAEYKAHVEQEKKQNEEAAAQAKAAQEAEAQGTPGLPNDAGSVAVRRCLDLGGGPLQCLGKGMTVGLFDLAGMKPPQSSLPARLTLTGVYAAGSIHADFNEESMAFGGCANLVNQNLPYSIERKGDQFLVHIKNSPSPYTLLLEPDGKLVGPGPTLVSGQIITGYHHYWQYKYDKETGETIPGSTHEVTVPIYAPKTERCSIATLAPTGRSQPYQGVGSWLAQMGDKVFAGEAPASAISSIGKDMPDPGIRLAGVYTSQGGLKANFSNAAVVLDCGEAHVMDKYSVERAGSQILIHVQNPASPFTATVQPDGSLSGPASVEVAGRIATGMTGDQVAYASRNASCSAARLFHNGATSSASAATSSEPAAPPPASPVTAAPSAASAANASAPFSTARPRASMRILLRTGFAGADPLAGQRVYVMRDRMDEALRKIGLSVPAGTTPGKAVLELAAACVGKDCKPVYAALGKYFITSATLDSGGKATLSAEAMTGPYYFYATARTANGALVWDVPANLVAGDNTVTLTAANAEQLK
jgi:hypothetical protein